MREGREREREAERERERGRGERGEREERERGHGDLHLGLCGAGLSIALEKTSVLLHHHWGNSGAPLYYSLRHQTSPYVIIRQHTSPQQGEFRPSAS